MSAGGKEPFYEKLGFERRPTENRGAGMMKMVGREEKWILDWCKFLTTIQFTFDEIHNGLLDALKESAGELEEKGFDQADDIADKIERRV